MQRGNRALSSHGARPWILAGVLLLALSSLSSRIWAAELAAAKAERINAKIAQFMQEKRVPGLSLAAVVDHELCYERGYGLADIENEVPATRDSVYRLASISKMLTAVAVMQLVESGKLDLSAPIQKYVSDFPEKQAPITCELLLKHQSGIRHYKGKESQSAVNYRRVSDSFGVFKNDPLLFAPGEKYSYTTYGYNVLGAAIEGASGQDYVGYVRERLAQPAGMNSLQPDSVSKIIPHRAAGYRITGPFNPEVLNDYAVDVSNKIPGGGWCSTAGDLCRFAVALCQGKLVSSQTLEQMWTPQKTSTGKQTDSGLGCFIQKVDGARRISHSGGQPKVSTFLVFSPERRTAVAVMCNLRSTPLKKLAGEVMDVLEE